MIIRRLNINYYCCATIVEVVVVEADRPGVHDTVIELNFFSHQITHTCSWSCNSISIHNIINYTRLLEEDAIAPIPQTDDVTVVYFYYTP